MTSANRPFKAKWLFKLNNNRWQSIGWSSETLFSLDDSAIANTGDLALILVDDQLIIARWFPNIADQHWLIDPCRITPISNDSLVAILGILTPLIPFNLSRAYLKT